jgi:hypothetical protein
MIRLATVVFAFIVLSAFSCRKKEGADTTTSIKVESDLVVEIKHHFYTLPNCTVYIKQNATAFPGKSPSFYNSEYKISDASGLVQFTKLANGDYVLYAIGYDPSVADTSWGYNFVTLNTKPGDIKEYDLTVPVSEQH